MYKQVIPDEPTIYAKLYTIFRQLVCILQCQHSSQIDISMS